MKAFYIPPALMSVLSRDAVSVAALSDLQMLLSTLSDHDVAFYLLLQKQPARVLPLDVTESFTWLNIQETVEALRLKLNDDEAAIERLSGVNRYLTEWSMADGAPAPFDANCVPTCDLWDEETVVFSHRVVEENADTTLQSFYDRLLQQLYILMPFETLASLPVFSGYLTTMQATTKSAS